MNNEAQSIEVQSNAEGYWEYQADPALFSNGLYNIISEDANGNKQEKSIFIFCEETPCGTKKPAESTGSILGNAINIKENQYLYISIIVAMLLMLILTFIFFKIKFKKIEIKFIKKVEGKKILRKIIPETFQRKVIKPLFVICLALIIIIISYNFYLNKGSDTKGNLINITGKTINPLDNLGYSNVELTYGNNTIKTSSSGEYVFNQIFQNTILKINNPSLIRNINKLVVADKETFYFHPDLFNMLSRVIDNESREDSEKNYEYLFPDLNADKNKFLKNYKTIFGSKDINDQELIIVQTEMINNWLASKYNKYINQVISIEVTNDGKNDTYYFTYAGGKWWLVK